MEHVDDADFLFPGEAELTVPEFVRDFEMGVPQHVYQTDAKPDLTTSPIPDFGLVQMSRYSSMAIQYSRGCPFNCEFCDIIEIYGRVPRTKTNEQMLAELDAIYRTGWRGALFIVDDNFIGNKKNVRKLMPALCEWMERHDQPFRLFTEASINLAMSPLRTFVTLTVPLMASGLIGGMILVWITAASELSSTIVLYTSRWSTMTG